MLLPLWALLGRIDDCAAGRVMRKTLSRSALPHSPSSQRRHRGNRCMSSANCSPAHVRFEERELFGLIELDLGDATILHHLARAVLAAEDGQKHGP